MVAIPEAPHGVPIDHPLPNTSEQKGSGVFSSP